MDAHGPSPLVHVTVPSRPGRGTSGTNLCRARRARNSPRLKGCFKVVGRVGQTGVGRVMNFCLSSSNSIPGMRDFPPETFYHTFYSSIICLDRGPASGETTHHTAAIQTNSYQIRIHCDCFFLAQLHSRKLDLANSASTRSKSRVAPDTKNQLSDDKRGGFLRCQLGE